MIESFNTWITFVDKLPLNLPRPPHPKKYAGFEHETSWIDDWKKRLVEAGDSWASLWLSQQVLLPPLNPQGWIYQYKLQCLYLSRGMKFQNKVLRTLAVVVAQW